MSFRFKAGEGGGLTLAFVGPLVVYVIAFLVLPTLMLLAEAFSGKHGLTLKYVAALGQGQTVVAFRNSLVLSALAALVGVIAGGIAAYLVLRPGMPRGVRSLVTSFSAVAANFAGVPLAFAFIATLGSLGIITVWLKSVGVDLYGMGFSLYSLPGLVLVYAYFQIPLMIIVFTPALEALRREWREAAENLGASAFDYWRHVGLPILLPSLLSAFILLFGNAFSAYATPYALTSGIVALVPVEISNVLSGNVMISQQTGAALALGMIVVMVAVMGVYALAARRIGRWGRR
ncbi:MULTISPECIES: ABC transporter permease subunit [Acidiphilium]|uniref:Binding-protein-dependent transport systems inner membrane component n=2 Tax=Acidiphilium TaxID=522 RepID=A5FX68_ACICJ|nr:MULTISPECIES: ABC transporter permease subunit [Acidiphilium]MBU6355588.1 ABC transporter permease subunit [Rhodospirillales bacterium]ABQ30200.1 binding-protein-dependent transport systems inner membrane component [Acidiphilium cryptum JF-5]KDM65732.1 putative ABC transporter permease protein [Acidiphilium sp. JA12-A1]MBS3022262.1 ABC transporter permease subunit [Acidiphilium multivorum]MDE2329030.1 ABC transporter permease subunit [Rhodospirillales bacterium]